MSLWDKDDPVIVIGKEEGEVEWETWIEDNEVVTDEDSGHISCDSASTWI